MCSVEELRSYLENKKADFELIKQDKPILSAKDAEGYYEVEKSAPTFILDSEDGLIACIVSISRGRLNFEEMKKKFGYTKLKMADRNKIEKITGYKAGSIPPIGHELPCIFDDKLLNFNYVYAGTGDELITLKINPNDIKRLNKVISCLS